MATFKYSAKDSKGKKVSGTLDAENRAEALASLQSQRLVVMKVVPAKKSGAAKGPRRARPSVKKGELEQAAAEAAISVGLPYVYTASFDTAGRTMMGLPPANLATVTADLAEAPLAFGANCGVGASDLLLAIRDMPTVDHVVVAKANCGIPQIRGDSVAYTGTPELMADYARLAMDCGVRIIGGCCGTTPEHVRAMRDAIDSHARGPRPEMEQIIDRLGPLIAPPASADRTSERGDRKGRRRRSAA